MQHLWRWQSGRALVVGRHVVVGVMWCTALNEFHWCYLLAT